MYPTWRCTEPLLGVAPCGVHFLAWSTSAVYKVSADGKLIDRRALAVGVAICGAPAAAADGSRWLLAFNGGFCNANTCGMMDECRGALCALDETHVLTRSGVVNILTGDVDEHGRTGVVGGVMFNGVRVLYGSFGLLVGKKLVSDRSVTKVWRVVSGLWYAEYGSDTLLFWNAHMRSERDMRVLASSDRALCVLMGVGKTLLVRDALAASNVADYCFFESFVKPHAVAISSARVVAGILPCGNEIVLYNEAERASQAWRLFSVMAKIFAVCMIFLFTFSIFY